MYEYLDLVTMKAYKYDGSDQQLLEEMEIPSDMTTKSEEYRAKLIEGSTPACASINATAPSRTLKLL